MRLAIFGATSQIAKDLVLHFAAQSNHELVLYGRRPEAIVQWLSYVGLAGRFEVVNFNDFNTHEHFDGILNFVGVGDPAKAALMGAHIFDVTLQYDDLALNYVRNHPECRYIFLSSGAAYGANFFTSVDEKSLSYVAINKLKSQDWYGVAKLHAECRHRALGSLPIVDVRVFSYFSHTQDMNARFLMTDIVRAVRDNTILKTSDDYIVRDFINPLDFFKLISVLLLAPAENVVVDTYSLKVIDKPDLLAAMKEKFGLHYEISQSSVSVNATGDKSHYYSRNTRAADFGYQPTLTSLEGIVKEMQMILQGTARGTDRA
ncbi:MAG: NAD-dependent epimerase/dehydratase family protein [Limnohabitans sp.]|uniref:NAD-dependent epimerase/dehydratase family protein n=1 Tax=Limnohabitans sp. TaxID=1907725 RepID=UPI003C76F41E